MIDPLWYDNLEVKRFHKADGTLAHIDIHAPNANGQRQHARVFPGTTNEFLADLIFGLQFELESKTEELRINQELTKEI